MRRSAENIKSVKRRPGLFGCRLCAFACRKAAISASVGGLPLDIGCPWEHPGKPKDAAVSARKIALIAKGYPCMGMSANRPETTVRSRPVIDIGRADPGCGDGSLVGRPQCNDGRPMAFG